MDKGPAIADLVLGMAQLETGDVKLDYNWYEDDTGYLIITFS